MNKDELNLIIQKCYSSLNRLEIFPTRNNVTILAEVYAGLENAVKLLQKENPQNKEG